MGLQPNFNFPPNPDKEPGRLQKVAAGVANILRGADAAVLGESDFDNKTSETLTSMSKIHRKDKQAAEKDPNSPFGFGL